jgi:hypothetical protein
VQDKSAFIVVTYAADCPNIVWPDYVHIEEEAVVEHGDGHDVPLRAVPTQYSALVLGGAYCPYVIWPGGGDTVQGITDALIKGTWYYAPTLAVPVHG